VLFEDDVKADPQSGNHIAAEVPDGRSGDRVRLTIRRAEGTELIAAEAKIR
jgi:hypothetical protein